LQQKRRLCGIEHTCDCDVNDDALDDTRSTIAAFAALVQHFYVRIAELEASVQAERASASCHGCGSESAERTTGSLLGAATGGAAAIGLCARAPSGRSTGRQCRWPYDNNRDGWLLDAPRACEAPVQRSQRVVQSLQRYAHLLRFRCRCAVRRPAFLVAWWDPKRKIELLWRGSSPLRVELGDTGRIRPPDAESHAIACINGAGNFQDRSGL